jgi:hypothetical protein
MLFAQQHLDAEEPDQEDSDQHRRHHVDADGPFL